MNYLNLLKPGQIKPKLHTMDKWECMFLVIKVNQPFNEAVKTMNN